MRSRVTTRIVWDMETWEVLEHEYFPYNGIWDYVLGGASAGEKGIAKDETEFMSSLQGEQSQQFSQEQQAQQEVQKSLGTYCGWRRVPIRI